MRGGAFLKGKEGRVGFRKKSPKYFLEKILLVFERTIKILQHLMLRILLAQISMLCRNTPINTQAIIKNRDATISLRVIKLITLSIAAKVRQSFYAVNTAKGKSISMISLSSVTNFIFALLQASIITESP